LKYTAHHFAVVDSVDSVRYIREGIVSQAASIPTGKIVPHKWQNCIGREILKAKLYVYGGFQENAVMLPQFV